MLVLCASLKPCVVHVDSTSKKDLVMPTTPFLLLSSPDMALPMQEWSSKAIEAIFGVVLEVSNGRMIFSDDES